MIVSVGTDIVEVLRIGWMIERHGDQFLTTVFTPDEIRYCQCRREYTQHYAGRWAAKEAVMKALGTGFVRGIGWKDIEVAVWPSGKPYIRLHGGVRDHAEQLGIRDILISISHCRTHATATAIGCSQVVTSPGGRGAVR
uniref:Holo-[acyl-carrier-protein] synthase n=1 Tax=Schlesneria paludicola TaxID=360056 RepID=A0A7C4QMT7_9PLAN